MKTTIILGRAALALAITATALTAQDGERRPRGERPPPREEGGPQGERGRMPPPPPLLAALDVNRDGVIDSAEIDGAPAALRKLDKDGDGKLSPKELRPTRPEGEPGKPPQQ